MGSALHTNTGISYLSNRVKGPHTLTAAQEQHVCQLFEKKNLNVTFDLRFKKKKSWSIYIRNSSWVEYIVLFLLKKLLNEFNADKTGFSYILMYVFTWSVHMCTSQTLMVFSVQRMIFLLFVFCQVGPAAYLNAKYWHQTPCSEPLWLTRWRLSCNRTLQKMLHFLSFSLAVKCKCHQHPPTVCGVSL